MQTREEAEPTSGAILLHRSRGREPCRLFKQTVHSP
uniref:Uncharacterized protein n=1 Tax=Anguilla anguilla TaxID=7936 RepID=A0A0E9V633_ANGAN